MLLVFLSLKLYSQDIDSTRIEAPKTKTISNQPIPKPFASIINPKNGNSVSNTIEVNGIVKNISNADHLWLVVNPKGSNEWLPQIKEIKPDKNDNWVGEVSLKDNKSKLFEIHLFIVNNEFSKYLEKGKFPSQFNDYNSKSYASVTVNKVTDEKNQLLFGENFESELTNWEERNSGGEIEISEDPQKGKVLKISRSSIGGDTFLQQDISSLVIGKKIKIICQIKLEDVIKNQNFSWGQFCVKFDYDDYTCYNAVQNLSGTKDWAEYKAVKDGRYNFSNTGIESIILIPEKATNVILYFGLQNTSGTIYFSNLQILEVL